MKETEAETISNVPQPIEDYPGWWCLAVIKVKATGDYFVYLRDTIRRKEHIEQVLRRPDIDGSMIDLKLLRQIEDPVCWGEINDYFHNYVLPNWVAIREMNRRGIDKYLKGGHTKLPQISLRKEDSNG